MRASVGQRLCLNTPRGIALLLPLIVVMAVVPAYAQSYQPIDAVAPSSATPSSAQEPKAPSAATPKATDASDVTAVPQAHDIAPGMTSSVSASKIGLPHDLTPWGMFLAADLVVKTVMVGLALASFIVWTIWLGKSVQLFNARRALTRELTSILGQTSVATAAKSLNRNHSVARGMLDAAQREIQSAHGPSYATALDRISTRLGEIESDANRTVRGGMSFLATVAATAPFIGLFGTVWGIMNSFIGISETQTTNLAVVAPGIAEALLATAIGLVAAIPAVILYNQLNQNIAGFKRLMRETKGEVWRIVSRQADALSSDRSPSRLHVAAE